MEYSSTVALLLAESERREREFLKAELKLAKTFLEFALLEHDMGECDGEKLSLVHLRGAIKGIRAAMNRIVGLLQPERDDLEVSIQGFESGIKRLEAASTTSIAYSRRMKRRST